MLFLIWLFLLLLWLLLFLFFRLLLLILFFFVTTTLLGFFGSGNWWLWLGRSLWRRGRRGGGGFRNFLYILGVDFSEVCWNGDIKALYINVLFPSSEREETGKFALSQQVVGGLADKNLATFSAALHLIRNRHISSIHIVANNISPDDSTDYSTLREQIREISLRINKITLLTVCTPIRISSSSKLTIALTFLIILIISSPMKMMFFASSTGLRFVTSWKLSTT